MRLTGSSPGRFSLISAQITATRDYPATLFVLLVVYANLQFARSIARRPQIAIRVELGAGRWRIIRQLLRENLLLGLGGALGGLAFACLYLHITIISMLANVARWIPGWSNTLLNGRALAFTLSLAVLGCVFSGTAPALEALRVKTVDQLKSGSRVSTGSARAHRLRNIFAVAQVAFAVAQVIGAAPMSKSMDAMLHATDLYNPGNIFRFIVTLPPSVLPGVIRAEVAAALPYSDMGWVHDRAIENRPVVPGKYQSSLQPPVSEDYFSAFTSPLWPGGNS